MSEPEKSIRIGIRVYRIMIKQIKEYKNISENNKFRYFETQIWYIASC